MSRSSLLKIEAMVLSLLKTEYAEYTDEYICETLEISLSDLAQYKQAIEAKLRQQLEDSQGVYSEK